MASNPNQPSPVAPEIGRQMDDNIDDLGRRPDGTTEEQPGTEGRDFDDVTVEADRNEDDTTDNPNPSPMNPAFP